MSKTALEELKKVIQVNPYLTLESIRSESFIFEKRVRLNCFYCTKYNGPVHREFQNLITKRL